MLPGHKLRTLCSVHLSEDEPQQSRLACSLANNHHKGPCVNSQIYCAERELRRIRVGEMKTCNLAVKSHNLIPRLFPSLLVVFRADAKI